MDLGYKPSNVIIFAKFAAGDGTNYFFDNAKDGWSVESYTGTGGTTYRMDTRTTITENGFTTTNTNVRLYTGFYYIAFK